jgi:hypothetical protein
MTDHKTASYKLSCEDFRYVGKQLKVLKHIFSVTIQGLSRSNQSDGSRKQRMQLLMSFDDSC